MMRYTRSTIKWYKKSAQCMGDPTTTNMRIKPGILGWHACVRLGFGFVGKFQKVT